MSLRSGRFDPSPRTNLRAAGIAILALLLTGSAHAQSRMTVAGEPAKLAGSAIVNFQELARRENLGRKPEVRPLINDVFEDEDGEPGAVGTTAAAPNFSVPFVPFASSPSPTTSFMGLDDIPMVDSSYIIIPPDVDGAVGQSKILEGLNNNYRILDKATGAVLSTVGTATFWAPTGIPDLLSLTDPRTLYDPINNRWIVEMQTVTSGAGDILVGVSQTSDPSGNWFLYRFSTGATIDFPIVGFNKNWITVAINRYSAGGAFQRGISLIVNYPLARTGTGSGTIITQAVNSHFCTAPCMTYSATSDTLYLVTHLSSSGATYALDTITGTAAAPVYTAGGSQTRPGGGWVQSSGNLLPQSAPNSGTSACGATPCPIEVQDAQVRSAPVYRGGFIYYTQTVGLPSSGLTHTGVQWTKLNTPSGTVADGGRLEDPTATATNGGKWYAYPHIAVAANGTFMVGFSQFASNQHPSAGYAMHLAGDGAGTIRDALIDHPGEDYYHKTFTTATGRNRWGDYSKAQVDPVDDQTLWTVNEYAKARTGTDDGNTGGNSSRWSTWWAAVAGSAPVVTIDPGPVQNEGNAGTSLFGFTARLSAASGSSVTVNYATSDGSATAGSDYQAASSFITIPAGSTSGAIPINVFGDTDCEPSESFAVTLTGATGATLGSPVVATGTIANDDGRTITASAGAGGSISPSGAVPVGCGANQAFTITPAAGYHVLDVLVDGSSVGAVATYTFTNVTANHTIDASFALDSFTITATAGANGSISPSGAIPVASGADQAFAITPDAGYHVADVLVDGSSVGAVTTYTFTNVTADHTINASFATNTYTITATSGTGGTIDPIGTILVNSGADQSFTITPDAGNSIQDVLVDSSSVGPVTTWTFLGVVANHTISASFYDGIVAVNADTNWTFAVTGITPNPSHGSVHIDYSLPTSAPVNLSVIDIRGREVTTLASATLARGRYTALWNGKTARGRAPSGVYFVRLRASTKEVVRRFVLTR